MSDEPKRRETAEEKEDRRRREIEGLMESMNRTAPKAKATQKCRFSAAGSSDERCYFFSGIFRLMSDPSFRQLGIGTAHASEG
jgi:hypothetical protein